MDGQRFCLRWDGFKDSVSSLLDQLREDGELLDVTLCCDGHQARAHRLVLSMCSPYFRQVLKSHPCQQLVLFLRDTPAADLTALLQFMYRGSVDVKQAQLASFIKTAEMLQIRGLSGDDDKPPPTPPAASPAASPAAAASPRHVRAPPTAASPLEKRRRLSESGTGFSGSGSGSGTSGSGFGPRTSTCSDAVAGRGLDGASAAPPQGQSQRSQADRYQRTDREYEQAGEKPLKSEREDYGRYQTDQREQYQDWYPEGDQERRQEQHQERQRVQEQLKQEPIDLTEDDDMDAALGCVAAIEASYGGGQQSQTGGVATGTVPLRFRASAGNPAPMTSSIQAPMTSGAGWPMPASSKAAAPAAAGASAAGPHTCSICGRGYKRRDTLLLHIRKHQGLTTCGRCGKVLPTRSDLRRHLLRDHQMSREEALVEAPPIGAISNQVALEGGRQGGFERRPEAANSLNKSGFERRYVNMATLDGRILNSSAVERSLDSSELDGSAVDTGGLDGSAVDTGEVDAGAAVDGLSVDEPGVDGGSVDDSGQEMLVIPEEEFETPGGEE